jgi:AcrR family transcriptional regulator
VPKVPTEYLELRRQQILDAAAACFARRGFHQTTMQDICTEAELSPGAVYRYFDSKEEIIEAACQAIQDVSLGATQAAMEQGSTQDVVDELLRLFFLELEDLLSPEHCALNVELISEAPRSEAVREMLQRKLDLIVEQFVDFVAKAQARGDINPDLAPEAVAHTMIGLFHGFITQKLIEPDLNVRGYGEVIRALFNGSFWQGAGQSPAAAGSAEAALRH